MLRVAGPNCAPSIYQLSACSTVPIFFAIVVFIGFFGNLLVVLVVTFNRQMRNTTNLGRGIDVRRCAAAAAAGALSNQVLANLSYFFLEVKAAEKFPRPL